MTAALFVEEGILPIGRGPLLLCIHDLFRFTAPGRTDHSVNVMKMLFGSGAYEPKGATSAKPALR